MKKCNVCYLEKELEEFSKHKDKPDGCQATCKECAKLRFKKYYDKNKQKHRKTVKRAKENKSTRICSECNKEKEVCEFKSKRGRLCITCKKNKNLSWNKKCINNKKDFIRELRTQCVVCLEDDADVLDFHHLRDKSFNIGRAAQEKKSYDLIIEEIKKCIILCANCHRKYHKNKFCLIRDK